MYCCFGKIFNALLQGEDECITFLPYFGTHRKSLYKQSHLDYLLGSRFDKLKMESRLFDNSVNTAGNDSLLLVRQSDINRLSTVDEFVKCRGQFRDTKLIFVQMNRGFQRKLSRRITIPLCVCVRVCVCVYICMYVCMYVNCSNEIGLDLEIVLSAEV
jgi:hypothetical protein